MITAGAITMNYKLGLANLKKLAESQDWFSEFLLFEARLLENLHDERLYGSSEQYRNVRNHIVDQLNRLAYTHLKVTFNDLCRDIVSQTPDGSLTSLPEIGHGLQTVLRKGTTKATIPTQVARTDVFISYSPEDKRFLTELQRHLRSYVRSEIIKVWDETMILPGAKWKEEIIHALQRTKIAILLISADFLASDFIANEELPYLLSANKQEEIKILCVALSPCDFENTELAQFKPVNPLSMPLTSMPRGKREEVWLQVAKLVRDLMLLPL
jgi:TIR domain